MTQKGLMITYFKIPFWGKLSFRKFLRNLSFEPEFYLRFQLKFLILFLYIIFRWPTQEYINLLTIKVTTFKTGGQITPEDIFYRLILYH